MVLHDHVGTRNNRIYRIKQAIELFCPALKGILLPPNIRHRGSLMERNGVVPSKIVQIRCTVNKKGNKVNKKGNKKGTNTFCYCTSPIRLLDNMIKRMFLDNTFQDNQDFSPLIDMIVVSVGFDKSYLECIGTWCPCNRKNGNSAHATICMLGRPCIRGVR